MNALIGGLARRIVLTGIGVFLLGALLLHFILTRFFTRPLEELLVGFAKVGHGDFTYWGDVECGGEIGQMADSFNIMSRAIGRYVGEIREGRAEVEAHFSFGPLASYHHFICQRRTLQHGCDRWPDLVVHQTLFST